MLGLGRNLTYSLIRRGWIPSARLGRRIVVPVSALEKLIGKLEAGEWPPHEGR